MREARALNSREGTQVKFKLTYATTVRYFYSYEAAVEWAKAQGFGPAATIVQVR